MGHHTMSGPHRMTGPNRVAGGHHYSSNNMNGFLNRGHHSLSRSNHNSWVASSMMPGMVVSSPIIPVGHVSSPPSSSSSNVRLFNKSQSSDSPPSVNGYRSDAFINSHHRGVSVGSIIIPHQQFLQRQPLSHPMPHSRHESHLSNFFKTLCLSYLSKHKSLLIVSLLLFLTGVAFAAVSFIPHLDKDISHSLYLVGLMFSTLGSCVFAIMMMFSIMCNGWCFNRKIKSARVSQAEAIQNHARRTARHSIISSTQSNGFATANTSLPNHQSNNISSQEKSMASNSSKRKDRDDSEIDDEITSLEEFREDSNYRKRNR